MLEIFHANLENICLQMKKIFPPSIITVIAPLRRENMTHGLVTEKALVHEPNK